MLKGLFRFIKVIFSLCEIKGKTLFVRSVKSFVKVVVVCSVWNAPMVIFRPRIVAVRNATHFVSLAQEILLKTALPVILIQIENWSIPNVSAGKDSKILGVLCVFKKVFLFINLLKCFFSGNSSNRY